jgi:hypothetical protein
LDSVTFIIKEHNLDDDNESSVGALVLVLSHIVQFLDDDNESSVGALVLVLSHTVQC